MAYLILILAWVGLSISCAVLLATLIEKGR
jgi:hypothetical protein